MANSPTNLSLQYLFNFAADFNVSPPIPRVGLLGQDDSGIYRNIRVDTLGGASSSYTVKITTVSQITYIAKALPGTAQSAGSWQALKIDETSGFVLTWADGNANFDNVATDLTALSYS